MSDVTYLTIPGEQVGVVTKAVLALYGARAEALGAIALAVGDLGDDRVEVEQARRELRAMEDALMDLGWPDRTPEGPVEIVGRPRVLREVARASLLDSADRVVEALRRYEAGGEELPAVAGAVEAVPALFAVFATLDGERAQADEREAADEREG